MLAFKRSYGISNINNISDFHTYINDSIENSNLSKDEKKVFTRIQDIINIINGELKNSKEIRNKVGHGQWIFAVAKVNSSENPLGIDLIKTVMIGGENKLTLINKKVIFENLSILIEYMIVSPKTKSNAKNAFEKHFDRYYNIIKSAYIDFYESENDLIESSYNNIRQKYNIFTESSYYRRKLKYEEFKKKVIDRKKRGIDYKRRNINKKFKVLFLSFFIFSILGYLTIHYFFIG